MTPLPTIECAGAEVPSRTPTMEEWRIAGGKIASSALTGLELEESLLLGRRKRVVKRVGRKVKPAKAPK